MPRTPPQKLLEFGKLTQSFKNEVHEHFMRLALDLAREAMGQGEAPVGAVIVKDGQVVGRGHNRVYLDNDPVAHAEILAIREAAKGIGDWRLLGATAYVTLEPCIMCAAALIHARVPRLMYGARDVRWGGVGSLFDLSHDPRMNHELEVISGVMGDEAAELLQTFFRRLRQSRC
jgi:tRNA(adenine34) deaminase